MSVRICGLRRHRAFHTGIDHRMIVRIQNVFLIPAVPGNMNLPHSLMRNVLQILRTD